MIRSSSWLLSSRDGADGSQYPHVGAASTEIGFHMGSQSGFIRMRVDVQKRLRSHDHPRDAITALNRLLLDERGLQRIGFVLGTQPLDGRNRPIFHGGQGDQARENRLAS